MSRSPSPLAQARGDQQVLADALAVEGERAQRLGDPLDSLALQRIARGASTQGRNGPFSTGVCGTYLV